MFEVRQRAEQRAGVRGNGICIYNSHFPGHWSLLVVDRLDCGGVSPPPEPCFMECPTNAEKHLDQSY